MTHSLRIEDGHRWWFANGTWIEDDAGCMSVAPAQVRRDGDGMQGHHHAFHRDCVYTDVRIRFEFMLRGHSDLGIIFRGRCPSQFYLLHFPCCGQARRAQHFWAAFSRMDESGFLRGVKFGMVPRVASNIGRWVAAELTLSGGRLSVRIDEHG